jgi:transposase-like protein
MDKVKQEKSEKTVGRPRKRMFRHWNPAEKCRAVLAIWTERRKPTEICQELQVSWGMLNQWEKKALEGMMHALEPLTKREQRGPALGKRLQTMLEKRGLQEGTSPADRLEERLQKLQETRSQREEKI